jgi:hypothetical protein
VALFAVLLHVKDAQKTIWSGKGQRRWGLESEVGEKDKEMP